MKYYRHISLVYGLSKLLILLCAGFGIDEFFSRNVARRIFSFIAIILLIVFVMDVNHAGLEDVIGGIRKLYDTNRLDDFGTSCRLMVNLVAIALVSLMAALLLLSERGGTPYWSDTRLVKFIKGTMLAVLFLDMMSFQITYLRTVPRHYLQFLDTVIVNKPEYQMERTSAPLPGLRQTRAITLATKLGGAFFTTIYSFAQFDPCKSKFKTNYVSSEINELVNIRFAHPDTLAYLLGCNSPKIRLTENAVFFQSREKEREAIAGLKDPQEMVFLSSATTNAYGNPVPETDSNIAFVNKPFFRSDIYLSTTNYICSKFPAGYTLHLDSALFEVQDAIDQPRVQVREFSANKVVIDAQTDNKNGAWLVYADAYHPNWKATVNGMAAPVYEANLAFKAVHINQRKNIVKFTINDNFNLLYAVFNSVIGFLFALGFLLVLFKTKYLPSLGVRVKPESGTEAREL